MDASLARGKARCPVLHLCTLRQTWAFPTRGSLALPTWGFLDVLKPPSTDQLGPSLRSEGFLFSVAPTPCYYFSSLWEYPACLWPCRQLLSRYTKPKGSEVLDVLARKQHALAVSLLPLLQSICTYSHLCPQNHICLVLHQQSSAARCTHSTGANDTFACAVHIHTSSAFTCTLCSATSILPTTPQPARGWYSM